MDEKNERLKHPYFLHGKLYKQSQTMKILVKTALIVSLLAWFNLAGANSKGYVSFESLQHAYGEPKVSINLNAILIGVAGLLVAPEDPEIALMLKSLDNVSVTSYDIQGDSTAAISAMDGMVKKIAKENWQAIVKVNDEHEKLRVYAKYTGELMDGIVVMLVDKQRGPNGEAIFANIVGEIDPQNIAKVTQSLNIDLGI